ncbi:M48 family metallopeptidase [Rothia sp. CCM 9417]|uniref:M48 metallopeptidase family protein n=1 Tax=Rothia sp. CCM 9417 TaxID=3402657 RepID=UPI003ADCEFFE
MASIREVLPATAHRPEIEVVRSTRRRRTVQAQPLEGGRIRLMVPASSTPEDLEIYIENLLPKIQRRAARKKQSHSRAISDELLAQRAEKLRRAYLPQAPSASSIRWVTNQQHRWGSATPAERTIRIFHTLQGAPGYVLDSVIFHELCHFLEPNHSPQFRELEALYPEQEKARAFLEGVTFGQRVPGTPPPSGE